MHTTLRSEENERRYGEFIASGGLRECPLCRLAPIRTFTHWKIVENEYPYDLVVELHHMLVPLRHVTDGELTDEELREFAELKHDVVLHDTYQYFMEAARPTQSVPAHFHVHLVVMKDLAGVTPIATLAKLSASA